MKRKNFIQITTTASVGLILPLSALSKTGNVFSNSLPPFLVAEFGKERTEKLIKVLQLIRPECIEEIFVNLYSDKLKEVKQKNASRYFSLKSKFDNVLFQLNDPFSFNEINLIKKNSKDDFLAVYNFTVTLYYSNANKSSFRKTWTAIDYNPVLPCVDFPLVKTKGLIYDTKEQLKKHIFEADRLYYGLTEADKNTLLENSCK